MVDPHPADGAWADLVPTTAQDRVLFLGSDPLSPAVRRFRARTSAVTFQTPHAWEAASTTEWDLIVGEHLEAAQAVTLLGVQSYRQRVALVADNRFSPLRPGPNSRGWTPRDLRRASQTAGSPTVLALLRSSARPTSAFDLELAHVAEIVLGGAAVGAGRRRRAAIGALRALARMNLARPVVPSWLLIRSDHEIPTGRMGVAENDQGVILFGTGPDEVEKAFKNGAEVEAVEAAMAALDAAGIDVGGKITGRPGPLRLRLRWVKGDVLDANSMAAEDLARWTETAAEILGRIHHATRRDDGSVLTHGDFWLGAVIAEKAEIRGVIDWTDSRWDHPSVDFDSLVSVADTRTQLTPQEAREVLDSARRGYSSGARTDPHGSSPGLGA